MKKTLVFASMMLAALAASAAAVTPGPEPNKQVFTFTKTDSAAPELATVASKVLDGSAFAYMANPRELHPEGYLKM